MQTENPKTTTGQEASPQGQASEPSKLPNATTKEGTGEGQVKQADAPAPALPSEHPSSPPRTVQARLVTNR